MNGSSTAGVAYLRRSRVDDKRPGLVSYEAQEAEVRRLAARHGLAEPLILSDWGRSGGAGKEHLRTGYKQLREMVDNGAVTDVYSYDLPRLTRSLEEWVSLAAACRKAGVRVHLANGQTFDFSTADGEMVANILASVAQAVRRWAQERSVETARVRKDRGEHIGRTSFGSEDGEDATAVRDAFLEAGTYVGAAKMLNDRKVPTRFGRPWYQSSVAWVIRHQFAGIAPRSGTAGVRARQNFYLGRLLRCHCGRLMSATRKPNGRDPEYVTYRCDNGPVDPAHGRPWVVSENAILPWVKEEVARLRTPERVQLAETNTQARAELNGRKARIIDTYEAGHIDTDERERRLAVVYAALARLDDGERIVDVPTLDWSAPVATVNGVLRAMFDQIRLGTDLRPVAAEWTVPEWRA